MLNKLSAGIYIITDIQDGKQIKKVANKLHDLPSVLTKATFEPYIYPVMKKLTKLLKENEESYLLGLSKYITATKIVEVVMSCLKK